LARYTHKTQLELLQEQIEISKTLQEQVKLRPVDKPIGRPRVLLLNHTHVQCGVYQFGKRVYELAARSKKVDYFYKDLNSHAEYVKVLDEVKPHYVIYNWHWDRMPWLRDKDIITNKAMKHYFIYHDGSMMEVYDKYLFFGEYDPQKKDAVNNRILLPRPLFPYEGKYPVNTVPTIGSFGFAFTHKRFPELVTLVNNQFSEAVINIHMTLPFFGDSAGGKIADIVKACHKNNFRKEVTLNVTQHFMDDQQLLSFLAKNDINVFNYADQHNPGLSSVPDYALSVKRPIAITSNMMFRHIASEGIMLEKNSIKEILNKGIGPVEQYHDKWSINNFTSSMEQLFLPERSMSLLKPEVLFVNHKIPNCGVYQFGKRAYEQVAASDRVEYSYKEVDSTGEIEAIFRNPPKHIVFNWHRATMPCLTEQMVINNKKSKHYFLFHEEVIRQNYNKYFFFGDYDIGNKRVPLSKSELLPRPLFTYTGNYPVNEIFTVGSFGFGFWNKGFHVLVNRINMEFDNAIINLHIPYSHFGDPDKSQTHAVIAACRRLNVKPGIKLNITQSFLTNDEILTFLAGNDINAFLYSDNGEGLSSAVDYALSVKRPMMITDCQMFRHFKMNEIAAECNTTMSIYNRGLQPLEKVREDWATEKLINQMDEVFLYE
jgi:hypothetical protein